MEATERPSFESETGKRIYEYVERHGTANRNMLLNVVEASSDEFRSELDRLKSKGYLAEDGGTLRVDLDVGSVDEYESDVGQVMIRPARNDDFYGLVDLPQLAQIQESAQQTLGGKRDYQGTASGAASSNAGSSGPKQTATARCTTASR